MRFNLMARSWGGVCKGRSAGAYGCPLSSGSTPPSASPGLRRDTYHTFSLTLLSQSDLRPQLPPPEVPTCGL